MTFEFKYSESESITIKSFLKQKQFSRRLLKLVENITINYFPGNINTVLINGDIIHVTILEEKCSLMPYDASLNILFEDDFFLIVDKPTDLPSIPSMRHPHYSLANIIAHYYKEKNINANIHILTRLDKETSGIVLIAKHRYFRSLLHSEPILKKYTLFVKNKINDYGVIIKNIKKLPNEMKRIISEDGELAITEYKFIKNHNNIFEYQAILHTGKTHQIRLHFASEGAPLLGDTLYNGSNTFDRCALHCHEIEFIHPLTNEKINVKSNLPLDLQLLKTPSN